MSGRPFSQSLPILLSALALVACKDFTVTVELPPWGDDDDDTDAVGDDDDDDVPPTFPPEDMTCRLEDAGSGHLASYAYHDAAQADCGCELSLWSDYDGFSYFIKSVRVDLAMTPIPPYGAAAPPWRSADTRNTSITPLLAGYDSFTTHPNLKMETAATEVGGTYWYHVPRPEGSEGVPGVCEGEVRWTIEAEADPSRRSRRPPPEQTSTGSRFDAIRCVAGQRVVARFALGGQPGLRTLIPLQQSGPTRIAGIDIQRVTVVDWGTSSEVELDSDGGGILTPGAPTLLRPAKELWLQRARWAATTVPDGDVISPIVEIEGVCPIELLPPPIVRAPAYVVDASSGVPGLQMQRYLLRIVPDARPEPGRPTHHLMVEVEGIEHSDGVPLVQQPDGRFRVDADTAWFSLHGYVTPGPQGLGFDLQTASWLGQELGAVQGTARAYP